MTDPILARIDAAIEANKGVTARLAELGAELEAEYDRLCAEFGVVRPVYWVTGVDGGPISRARYRAEHPEAYEEMLRSFVASMGPRAARLSE